MNIEKYLVLNKYFLGLFGESENGKLLKYLKDEKEGESDGLTNFAKRLMNKEGVRLSEDELKRYDQNIQEYLRKINQSRPERIDLNTFNTWRFCSRRYS
jgi:hypothetical protein